jgi:hypothetical protein
LAVVTATFWLSWGLGHPQPGSLEDLFARIRPGMTQHEAVAVLRTYNAKNIDCIGALGVTKEGRHFGSIGESTFDDLPAAREVQHCELSVADEDGRSLDVILGPDGLVVSKDFSSPSPFWGWLIRVADIFRPSASGVSLGSLWPVKQGGRARSAEQALQSSIAPLMHALFE